MTQENEYFAFISYQRKDEEWADGLRSKLEHYRLPSSVRKQDASLPKEIRPIFRDTLELAGGVLAKEIETALQQSKFLIVICSPNSAKSPWVNKEIQTFIDLGREDRIIPFIIDGTPFSDNEETECFPPALRSLKGEKELLGININELSRDAASIKVVARMFGLKFDTLWQRYEREKKRKRWMIIGSVALLAIVALVVAGFFMNMSRTISQQNASLLKAAERMQADSILQAQHIKRITEDSIALAQQNDSIQRQYTLIEQQKDEIATERDNVLRANWKMMENQSLAVAEKGKLLIDEGDNYLARMLALTILPKNLKNDHNRPFVPEAEALLRNAVQKDNALLNNNIQVYDAAFSPNGQHLASANGDYTIRIWDRLTGACINTLKGHSNYVFSVEYTEDGNNIISIDKDAKEACIWDAHTGELLNLINKDIENSDSIIKWLKQFKQIQRYSPDGSQIAKIENKKNYVIIEDFSKKSKVLTRQKGGFYYASFSPNGMQVLTSSDSIIRIWDKSMGICTDSLIGHTKSVNRAVYNYDGTQIVSSSFDNTIRIWNTKTKDTTHILRGHKSIVTSVSFSKNGRYIVSTSADSTVRTWNAITGICIDSLKLDGSVNSAAYSPNGKYIVTGTALMDNKVKIWDVSNGKFGKCLKTLCEHNISVIHISFSPKGQIFASTSASTENAIIIWDINKMCSKLPPLLGHTNHVWSIAFSNDGSKIVSASEDNTIRVWDVNTGICLVVLKEHEKRVTHAEFSPDGRSIVSSSADGTIRIWDFPSLQELIDKTRERFKNRKLTSEERRKYYLE